MAVKDFLDYASALSHILEESDDDKHLNIIHEIDLLKLSKRSQFKSYSPVHLLHEHYGLKAQTCVEKVSQEECYSISLIIIQCPVKDDVVWPAYVEWKVCVVHADKEVYLDLPQKCSLFQKLDDEKNENEFTSKLQLTNVTISEFIKDEKLCFRWTIIVNGQTTPTNPVTPDSSFQTTDLKDHLKSIISKVQVLDENLNLAKHTEDLDSIHKVVSECENIDLKLENVKSAYQDINNKVEILKDKFVKQHQKLNDFLTDWDYLRTETTKEDNTTSTLHLMINPSSESLLENEITSTEQSGVNLTEEITASTTSKHLKLLLIGERMCGKSATGNSILKKRFFKSSGMNTLSPAIQQSTSFYSSDIQLTVVESQGCQQKDIMAALESCEDGFDAILCVFKYGEKYINDIFVNNISMKGDALKTFGIMLLTGGDSLLLDFPDKSLDDCVEQWIGKYPELQRLVQKRVVVFDNTTTCDVKKAGQLKTLLQTIQNLPGRPTRFNKDKFIKYGLKSLYNFLEGLHILTDKDLILRTLLDLSTFNKYSVDARSNKTRTFNNSLRQFDRKYQIDDHFEVLLIGKPTKDLDSTKSCIENMKIKCTHSQDPKTEIDKNIKKTLLIVISCINSSNEDDKQNWSILRAKMLPVLKQMGILVLIDGNELFSKEQNLKITKWCLQQTGLIKEFFEACSSRAVLLDYNTKDTLEKLSQELELVKFIDEILVASRKHCDLSTFSQDSGEYSFGMNRNFGGYENPFQNSRGGPRLGPGKALPDRTSTSQLGVAKKSKLSTFSQDSGEYSFGIGRNWGGYREALRRENARLTSSIRKALSDRTSTSRLAAAQNSELLKDTESP